MTTSIPTVESQTRISVLIFTLNEEVNLPHCLGALDQCDDIVVVDSFSQDRTCELARQAGARVFQHEFTGFGDQRMWALQTIPLRHPWALILDADERVTPALWREMRLRVADAAGNAAAFRLKRRFFWDGHWLRHANLYPSWVVRLIRVGKVKYSNRGHAETQTVDGEVGELGEDLADENFKGLEAWRERQRHYARSEAMYEAETDGSWRWPELWQSDPLGRRAAWKKIARRLPARGGCYFIYAYVFRGGWKDGAAGLRFCLEKARFQADIGRMSRRLRKGESI
ncbi:MAG: glycosyltransferase family 2 protein [Verrucomicrobiae bacterium]|nr:glycosyltransferase family 2 protein [Verrucomicrobiae bacterium]